MGKALGWFNTLLTAVVAIVASLAAIFSHLNTTRIETANATIAGLEAKLKDVNLSLAKLDVIEKESKERADYADVFLEKVLPDPSLKDNAKHVQALLSVLSIIAQTSETGASDPASKARAIVPLQLALLLGQPGGVAAMDVNYKYLDDWIAMALADDSPNTRLTAIQALTGVCQKALREKRLDVVSRGVQAVNQLLALVPEEQEPVHTAAIAARAQLASFIAKEENLLKDATLEQGNSADPEAVRSGIRLALQDATPDAFDTRKSLQMTVSNLQDSTKPADIQQVAQVRASLARLDGVLKNASAVQTAMTAAEAKVSAAPDVPGEGPTGDDPTAAAVAKILPNLASDNLEVRRKARADLALFRQAAVKPLLTEVSNRRQGLTHEDTLIRLGIAVALESMAQPINLDDSDAYWIVSLLQSSDDQTRHAATEFLMNLESGNSVNNCFDQMERVFYQLCKSPKPPSGNTVASIVAVVGTWARNITPDTESREPGKAFPVFAFEVSERWQTLLAQSGKRAEWASVLETSGELIRRAKWHLYGKSQTASTVH